MKILITILLLALGACTVKEPIKKLEVKRYEVSSCEAIKIITIDKCEYVLYLTCRTGSIIHKVNCSNPIHHEK